MGTVRGLGSTRLRFKTYSLLGANGSRLNSQHADQPCPPDHADAQCGSNWCARRTASRNEHQQTADYSPFKRKEAHAIRSSGAICIPDGAILEFRIMVRSVLPVV